MFKLHILLTVLIALPLQVFAFRLSPMVIEFAPQGGKATQVITLENPGPEKIPIHMEAFTRAVDKNNEEVRAKTSDFIIYPEQLVLLPNEKRNVRITYSGEDVGAEEKAYRIVASQLPVDFQEKNSQGNSSTGVSLNFLLQYVASAYVKPPGAKSKIVITEVKRISAKKISVLVKNEGTAHQLLKPKSFKILAENKVVLELNNFKDFETVNLLPKTSQVIEVAVEKDLPAQGLKAQMELMETED